MKWDLIESGDHTGKYNMDFDIELAGNCKDNEAFFRLYRWKPYAISLGANQSFEDIKIDEASINKIDVVKRPTGGRAILHAEEITYSVVIPISLGLSSTEIYKKISLSLVAGLKLYDSALSDVELENIQPDFAKLLKEPSGIACFASTAKSEVKFHGKKIIGSAQRKMNKVILQHGSILCGNFHNRIVDYLNGSDANIAIIKDELLTKTTEIETILNKKVDYNLLKKCLIIGFESEWDINFLNKKAKLLL